MIEIEFDSMEEAAEAVKELSYLGRAKIDKKINHHIERNFFLNSSYENALDQLKKAEKIFEATENNNENDENPVQYLHAALTVLKKLFESEKFRELENKGPGEIEDKLFAIFAEMDVTDRGVYDKFRNFEILKKETNEVYDNVLKPEIEEIGPEDEVKESNLPTSDEPNHNDLSDPEYSNSKKGCDSELPENNYLDKLFELTWKRQFLMNPIIESVYFHKDSQDPYSSFMDGVYLNVHKLADLFNASDFRMKVSSDIYVSYILDLGLEFILQKEDLINSISELPVVNENIVEEIQLVSVISDGILSLIEEAKKVKYRKFIFDVHESINGELFGNEELDVEFNVDSEFLELIIKDLNRIGRIKTKGKKIIRYAGK